MTTPDPRIAIEGGDLVLRIGVENLAFAAEYLDRLAESDEQRMSGGPYCKVFHPVELARDVCQQLDKGDEDGSTTFTRLLDQAIQDAFDDGSLAFEEEEPPMSELSDKKAVPQ